MPKFVIERQYLVPMQHIVVEADNLEGACKKGISDELCFRKSGRALGPAQRGCGYAGARARSRSGRAANVSVSIRRSS